MMKYNGSAEGANDGTMVWCDAVGRTSVGDGGMMWYDV